MPFIRLETTERIAQDQQLSLCAKLSRLCAEVIGKPEAYMMSMVHDELTIFQAGKPGPAAFVEVRSIGGLSSQVNRALSKQICGLITEELKIPGERIYLNMINVEGDHWGRDGATFG